MRGTTPHVHYHAASTIIEVWLDLSGWIDDGQRIKLIEQRIQLFGPVARVTDALGP